MNFILFYFVEVTTDLSNRCYLAMVTGGTILVIICQLLEIYRSTVAALLWFNNEYKCYFAHHYFRHRSYHFWFFECLLLFCAMFIDFTCKYVVVDGSCCLFAVVRVNLKHYCLPTRTY